MDMVLQLEVVIVRQSLSDVTLDSSKGEAGLCSKSWNSKTSARGGHIDRILCHSSCSIFFYFENIVDSLHIFLLASMFTFGLTQISLCAPMLIV